MKSPEDYIEEIQRSADEILRDLQESVNWDDIPEDEQKEYRTDNEEDDEYDR